MHILQWPDKCFREKTDQCGIYVFALGARKTVRKKHRRNFAHCRLLQKGREKLNTKASAWGLPNLPKTQQCSYQTASAHWEEKLLWKIGRHERPEQISVSLQATR